MPANKNALYRYLVIDTLLQKSKPTMDELKVAVVQHVGTEISSRTLQKDISDMRFDSSLGFNAPIKVIKRYTGSRKFVEYRYTYEGQYSIVEAIRKFQLNIH